MAVVTVDGIAVHWWWSYSNKSHILEFIAFKDTLPTLGVCWSGVHVVVLDDANTAQN